MRWTEWVIAIALVAIGLSCLTVSATSMLSPDSIRPYLHTFIQICLWAGIPVLLAVFFYLILRKKKGDQNE
jgi:hypothetical protein